MGMRLGSYTIPHTGTRFVNGFMRKHGIKFSHRHVAAPRTVPEWRHILTVRNPYDAYLTHRHRYPSNSDVNFVAMWGHYIWRTQWQDAFYFALDVPPENRRVMVQNLVMFCGYTPNWEIIDEFVDAWKPIGESGRDRSEEVPEHMIKPLEFAYEWYKHYTVFWGPQFRFSDNTLGEGD